MKIFECQNLELKLGDKIILHDFSFSFAGPGFILLEGENGAGKSSALKIFAGFIIPNNGQVLFDGNPVEQKGIGEFSFFTTTSLGLLNELTGMEHVRIIAQGLDISNKMVEEKINSFKTIEIFNEILKKQVADYSQGMRQFLRLFLHLFFEPKIIFLDEPFLYLSPVLKEFIQGQVESLATKSQIFITDQKFTWEPMARFTKITLGDQ